MPVYTNGTACVNLAFDSVYHKLVVSTVSRKVSANCCIHFLTHNHANSWCSHPKLAKLVNSEAVPPVLQNPRQLVELPERYSDLVKQASTFLCPQRAGGREYSDGQAAMLCLVCGEMLCTNSYCCQKVVDEGEEQSDEEKLRIGGFTQHAQRYIYTVGMMEVTRKGEIEGWREGEGW